MKCWKFRVLKINSLGPHCNNLQRFEIREQFILKTSQQVHKVTLFVLFWSIHFSNVYRVKDVDSDFGSIFLYFFEYSLFLPRHLCQDLPPSFGVYDGEMGLIQDLNFVQIHYLFFFLLCVSNYTPMAQRDFYFYFYFWKNWVYKKYKNIIGPSAENI